MIKTKVLLIEDEPVISMIIKETLEGAGFEVSVAENGVEGWKIYKTYAPDICVVDVMMPRKDGFSLVEDIRMVDELTPIIFLTAKIQTSDVLKGLEIGADDYMKKPFSIEELIMRINNLVKRRTTVVAHKDLPNSLTTIGSFAFDLTRLELTHNNKIFNLSQREAELLDLLLQHKNQLLARKTALLKLWGDENVFAGRSMDVYITRLRKYLALDPSVKIKNIRGYGYKLID